MKKGKELINKVKEKIVDIKENINNKMDFKIINAGIVVVLVVILVGSLFISPKEKLDYTNLNGDSSFGTSAITDIRIDNYKEGKIDTTQVKFRISDPVAGYNYCEVLDNSLNYLDKKDYSCLLPLNENQVGVIIIKKKIDNFYIIQNQDGERIAFSITKDTIDNAKAKLSDDQIKFTDNQEDLDNSELEYAKANQGLLFSKIEELTMTIQNKQATIDGLKEQYNQVSEAEKDNTKILLVNAQNDLILYEYDSIRFEPMVDLYNRAFKQKVKISVPSEKEVEAALKSQQEEGNE